MNEPSTVEGAGALGVAGWKMLGGLAGLGVLGAALASIVVMCLTRPRSGAEWTVALITTVVASISGGAALVMYLGIQHWAYSLFGLLALFGLVFACGLPGWTLVRWMFNYFERHREADLSDVAAEIGAGVRHIKREWRSGGGA